MKRKQKVVSPTQVLSEIIEETAITLNQQNEAQEKNKKAERKRVSFDLRIDLHKELKMQALIQERNIYNLIEEALEMYLTKK